MNRKSVNKGRQLKFCREYRGYSQSKLCKQIKGLNQPNLSRFENGFENTLKDDKVNEIMDFLNWPRDWLDKTPISICSSWDF